MPYLRKIQLKNNNYINQFSDILIMYKQFHCNICIINGITTLYGVLKKVCDRYGYRHCRCL